MEAKDFADTEANLDDLRQLTDLARTLALRRQHGHRPPMVVLAHDVGREARYTESDVDVVAANRALWNEPPGDGDIFMANLVANGWFNLVIQLGTSNSLERGLHRFLEQGQFLRLVRGEHSTDYLVRALSFDTPRARLLKLNGDIVGRSASINADISLERSLAETLAAQANSADVIWIGTPTPAQLERVVGKLRTQLWMVSSQTARWPSPPVTHTISGSLGTYANFSRELSILLANEELASLEIANRRRMTAQIKAKQPVDSTYSDRLIQRLAQEIREACDDWSEPTLLIYIHDPDAPGGTEVEKRIIRYLGDSAQGAPESIRIDVRGDRIRWVDRHAESLPDNHLEWRRFKRVVVVDSISFTGRTLELATQAVRLHLKSAEVYWAVLVASEQLLQNHAAHSIDKEHILRAFVTDRHDIFFPWGWTQATSALKRQVPLHDGHHTISINQRPWGTTEVLADQLRCSVRLHTIRAGHRLSYQRHALRDEFFVALDDYVGIEFDSEDGKVIEAAILNRGDYVSVPRGTRHRFAAYRDSVRLLEVAFGVYDQVHDIRRFADDYGRLDKLGDV